MQLASFVAAVSFVLDQGKQSRSHRGVFFVEHAGREDVSVFYSAIIKGLWWMGQDKFGPSCSESHSVLSPPTPQLSYVWVKWNHVNKWFSE